MGWIRHASPLWETKYAAPGEGVRLSGTDIEGYASLYNVADQSGDRVALGAYDAALRDTHRGGVKMLWQHDPMQPIGVWDAITSDERGLYVKGRILNEVRAGREALVLLEAGAIDGLSIGYRTVRAEKDPKGGRVLLELDLWEVSVVTFPMLPEARVSGPASESDALAESLAESLRAARAILA